MDRSLDASLMAEEGGAGTRMELTLAKLIIDIEDGRLGNGQAEPRLAEGYADSEVERQQGFAAAVFASEDGEAGRREEHGGN